MLVVPVDCAPLLRLAAPTEAAQRVDSMSTVAPLPVPTEPASPAAPGALTPRQFIVHCVGVVTGFAVLFAVFFSPIWLSDRLLAPGDGFTEYLPLFRMQPGLWTPLLFAGFPAAADPQSQSFYPLARFLALSGAWNAYVVSAYVLAACFTYGYVFTLTRSVVAALGAGLVYSMSGFFMAHLGHTTMVHTAAWMPLLLWALERMRRTGSPAWVLLASVAIGACAVAGHPQMFCYTLMTGAAYAVVVAWSAVRGTRWYYRTSLMALAVGLGLAAVQLLPAAELVALSQRATMDFAGFVSFALPWRESIQLLFPYLFGSVAQSAYHVPYFGTWGLTETTGYCGILPLGLALIGVMAHRAEAVPRFWVAVAILSLLLALGAATPLARVAYLIPGYNRFRCPARHFVHTSLAVAVLAGLGIAALQRGGADSKRLAGRAAVGILGLVGTGFAVIVLAREPMQAAAARRSISDFSVWPWANPAIGIPLAVAALSALLLSRCARTPARPVWLGLLALVIGLDLGSFGFFCEWHYWAPRPSDLEMPALLRAHADDILTSGTRIFSFMGPIASRDAGEPNLNLLWGIPSADGYTPLELRRAVQALAFADSRVLRAESQVLNLLAVRYLLVPRRVLTDPALRARVDAAVDAQPPTQGRRWRHIEDRDDVGLYQNLLGMPRAWTVQRVVTLPPESILLALQTSVMPDGTGFDPREVALVEEHVDLPVPPAMNDAQVSIVSDRNTEVILQARTAAEAFLVLSDTYYPGWRVAVDGRPAQLYRANYLLRGVVVPRGAHTIRFSFVPVTFYVGLGVSGLALLALLTVRRW